MAVLFVADIADIDATQLFARKKSILNEYYISKIERYKNERARGLAVAAAVLLEAVCRMRGHVDFARQEVNENKWGKPYLVKLPDFCYNLSHSGSKVACAVDAYPLGVDIQRMGNNTDMALAQRFFHATEARYVYEKTAREQRERFFSLWTLKESFIKAEGYGLSRALDSFHFSLDDSGIDLRGDCERAWCFKQYNCIANYKLALCLTHGDFPQCEDLTEALV